MKINDKVNIVGNDSGGVTHYFNIGDICKVRRVDDDTIKVIRENVKGYRNISQWVHIKDLKLIKD